MCVTTTVTATSKHSPQPSCCPALRTGGQAQSALIPCCPRPLCLRAGLPTRLPFLGCCPCFSLHTILLPRPWGPLCWDRLLATLLRARGNCSVFSPQSHHWEQRPRDTESSPARAVILQLRNAASPFQMHSSLGVCVSSRHWAVQQL